MGGGKVLGLFAFTRPTYRNSIKKGVYNLWAKPEVTAAIIGWTKKLTCNGCKYLNFYKAGCRRNQPPGQVRHLPTYTNGDDYIAVLRPPDCDYQKEQKPTEQVSTEG